MEPGAARERSIPDLRQMLRGSPVVVTLWRGKRLVGFGRASSDGIHRAVLARIVDTKLYVLPSLQLRHQPRVRTRTKIVKAFFGDRAPECHVIVRISFIRHEAIRSK